ncbi:hypothetical protein ACWNYQ_00765 [Candidatus Vidania fulgoroideorum]
MKKKRLGRGNSSKKGNTCCRGYKGQKSRSGFSKKEFFIGGQTPLNIIYPKYGFKKKYKIKKKKLLFKNKKIHKSFFLNFFFSKKKKKCLLFNNCYFINE